MRTRILVGLLLLMCQLHLQAQNLRALTPMDIASLKTVGNAAIAEDASTIAYTVRIQSDPTLENKPPRLELHLYNIAKGTSTPYVTRGNVRQFGYRPMHHAINFLNRVDNDKVTGLYEISLDGGEATLLYAFETSISYFEWSPDGTTLAFIANQPEVKAKPALPYTPELFEENLPVQRLYIVQPGQGQAKQVPVDGHFTQCKWSPDGKSLLCSKAPTSMVDDSYMAMQLLVIDAESMAVKATVDHQGKLGEFIWSPDSRQIAFIAGADIHDPFNECLFIVPSTGGKPAQLFAGWEGLFEQIIWHDANQLNFMGSVSTESVYGTIKPEPKAKAVTMPIEKGWNITHMDLADDGTMIFIADTYQYPSELFLAAKGQTDKKRLTDSNPFLKDIEFAPQEVVRYKAKDGLAIDGILIRPLHEESGKKYPLITVVHGGPEAHFNNGWLTGYSNPGQMGAAEGYAVFYPNYRGSTGRGVTFTLSSQGDPAGKEFDDIVDGVDYLIGTGLVDATKVGVTGGSYGGYATGWLSTRYSHRFAAGVMFVGISNNVSKWGTTDIPNEEYLVHARKWVYEDYDFFLKRSPVYYADQCKTPLLIMAGKEDTRVHPSQSMELYRHIKSRTTTPVELALYPGEGHGNTNSTARYDYNLRMMAWFDTYLKGAKGKS